MARKVAVGAVEAFWLALTAALIAGALPPIANLSRSPAGSASGCLFAGKGGVICNGSTAAAQKLATENANPCLSLGKGARYCPPSK